MSARWQRIRELFERAIESSSPEALLDAECADDSALRAEVEMLLSLRHKSGLAVDSPVFKLVEGSPGDSRRTFANPGDVLGGYRIIRFLASGGMGEVYAATDERTGEVVALKLLREFSNVARDREKVRARFEREAALASRIQHPNVCRMRDVDLEHDPPYCVMDLLEGETLAERISSIGKLSLDEALDIAAGICDGLQAAHQAGVIHRDLKPGNIFLLAESGKPVIIDFGLATAVQRDLALTKSGDMLGTLAYMAPEILEENRAAIGPGSDLYSLGVILFEMLTGKKPHAAESPLRLVMQRARRTDMLPAMRSLGLPAVWVEVIARCLESDPQQRFASAKQVREALQAGRASWRFRAGDPRVRLGFAAVVVALIALGGWLFWKSEYRPKPESAELYRQAQQAVRDSAPRRAVGLLEQAVQQDAGFLNAHSLLAIEYADLDQLDKAREQMLKATQASDGRWRVGPLERHVLDASRAAVVGDYSNAVRLYREVASLRPADRAFFELLQAEMLSQVGKTEDLLELSARLVRDDPRNFEAKLRYGQTLCRKRKFKEAAVEFEAAQRAYESAGNEEGLARALLVKVSNLRQDNEVDRRELLRVRELAKKTGNQYHDLRAVFRLALLAVSDDQIDEAIQMGSEAVARAQSLGMNTIASRALGDIGFALYIARKRDEALRFLEQGLALAQRTKSANAEATNRMRLSEVLFSPPFNRVKDAIQVMEPAVEWYRQARHEDVLSNVLVKWGGMLTHDPARLKEGEQILLEAMARGEKERDDAIQLMVTQRLASTYGMQDLPKSLAYWKRGLPVIRSMGVGVAMAQMGRTFSIFGDFESARAMFDELDRLLAGLPSGYSRKNMGEWSARERALASYREGACVPFPKIPLDRPYAEEFHAFVSECLGAPRDVLGRHRTAAVAFAADFDRLGDIIGAGRLWNVAARMSLALGDLQRAEQYALKSNSVLALRAMKTQQIESELVLRKALRRQPARRVEAEAVTARVLVLSRAVGFSAPYEKFNGRKDLQRLWAD